MRTVSIGNQSFESIREKNNFYIDKTLFIKEWWESEDIVTLITRPRRFGKTLNMSMLNCFFSNRYENRMDLFEGLSIWNDEEYRKIQGTYPVIFLSFASVKETKIEDAKYRICSIISEIYEDNRYLLESGVLSSNEIEQFKSVKVGMNPLGASDAIKLLCGYMKRYYGRKVLIFLDEYDTPLQEAYLGGYWDEMASFMRAFFNSTFKTNPHLDRAIMTGITRVSKESMFSDLNNLNVVTTTNDEYATCFGFTQDEVAKALKEAELSENKDEVKKWYDGFIFGSHTDIYNPWSITCYIDKKEIRTYWADTSSNGLAGKIIQSGSAEIKRSMEKLLNGESITVELDEQIVFNQINRKKNAIWSLLLASGYLKAEKKEIESTTAHVVYKLKITNLEVKVMFQNMITDWFEPSGDAADEFTKSLIDGDIKAMNYFMNKIALTTFSYFDTGNKPSEYDEPEKFYHGFVLGLMVGQRKNYVVKSNRESGFGRYDIMMIPKDIKNKTFKAIVIEFKVHDSENETGLKATVEAALKQIEEKKYDEELLQLGIEKKRIKHYGFAFKGKEVLIG